MPTVERRWRMVVERYRLGSCTAAADRLGADARTVAKWVRHYEATGGVEHQQQVSRCTRLLDRPEAVTLLLDGVGSGRSCRETRDVIKRELALQVSIETVRRALKCVGARHLRVQHKPVLTEAHKARRLEFALTWHHRRQDWARTVVTDSTYIYLYPQATGDGAWVLEGQEPVVRPRVRNSFRLHMYAGVSKYGRTPLFATVGSSHIKSDSRGVNADVYCELLDNKLLPACRALVAKGRHSSWIFQQDNARAHSAKRTLEYLEQQRVRVMEWPPCSPDLSWIENMWAWLKMQLSKRTDLTKENMLEMAQLEWASMPQQVHDAMFNSIQSRLAACIKQKGGHTGY